MSIHAVGDSWTCREGDTGLDRGWQTYALPAECRHGVSGSTAEEWATNHKGMCNRALAACSEGDVVIISLVGNDIRHAAEDGKITVDEIIAATVSLNSVVNKFRAAKCNVVLLKYCDPYSGQNVKAALGIFLMNTLVSGVAVAQRVRNVRNERHFNRKNRLVWRLSSDRSRGIERLLKRWVGWLGFVARVGGV